MKKSISTLAIVAMLSSASIGTLASFDAEAKRVSSFSSRSFSAPRAPAPAKPAKPAPAKPAKPAPAKPAKPAPAKPAPSKPAPVNMAKPTAPKPATPVNMAKPGNPIKPATSVSMTKPAVIGGAAGAAVVATSVTAAPSKPDMNKPTVATPTMGARTVAQPTVATPTMGTRTVAQPTVATPTMGARTVAQPTVATPVSNSMAPRPLGASSTYVNTARPVPMHTNTRTVHTTNNIHHNSGMGTGTAMALGLGGGLLLGEIFSNDAYADEAVHAAQVASLQAQLLATQAQLESQALAGNVDMAYKTALPDARLSSNNALLEAMIIKQKAGLFLMQGTEWGSIVNPTAFDQIAYIQYKAFLAAQQASSEIFGTPTTEYEAKKITGMIGVAAKGLYENATQTLQTN